MLIGHQRIVEFLASSVRSNRLAHAYLFVGPSQIGKKTVAFEFVKVLQCQKPKTQGDNFSSCGQCPNCLLVEKNHHPDVLLVEAGEKISDSEETTKSSKIEKIGIEQIRQIQHQINLSQFCAPYKVVIIDSAEQMTQEAGNCLLKTLEEPAQKSLLILISSDWQRILPTVISRCQLIKFLPVKHDLMHQGLKAMGFKDKSKMDQAIRFSCGRPGVAIELLEESDLWVKQEQLADELQKLIRKDLVGKFKYAQKLSQNIFEAQQLLNQWLIWFRDQILENLKLSQLVVIDKETKIWKNYSLTRINEIIKEIQKTQDLLKEPSFNSRLILENLMLKI